MRFFPFFHAVNPPFYLSRCSSLSIKKKIKMTVIITVTKCNKPDTTKYM